MIAKERDAAEHTDADKFSRAGAAAEKQLAHYLERAFRKAQKVRVLNDLRLVDESGDACQIDHLVLHRHGLVVVESKSVISSVRINEHGEWDRQWNTRWSGMPSPIKQAERQIELLRPLLNEHSEELLNKMLLGKVQMRFHNFPMEVLVAISDQGQIKADSRPAEVCKAEQVADRIRAIIDRHKTAMRSPSKMILDWSSNDGVYDLVEEELDRVQAFLIARHRPRSKAPGKLSLPDPPPLPQTSQPQPPPEQKGSGLGICTKCGEQAEILWGRYGYYWKCHHCDSNMPIKEYCLSCRGKLKLRKQKNRFFIYCEPCGTEELYAKFEYE